MLIKIFFSILFPQYITVLILMKNEKTGLTINDFEKIRKLGKGSFGIY
jgi:hypothetical protein